MTSTLAGGGVGGRADPARRDSNQFPAHPLYHCASLCTVLPVKGRDGGGGDELTRPAKIQTSFPRIPIPTGPLSVLPVKGGGEERRGQTDQARHDWNQFPAHPLTHWATLCSTSQRGGGRGRRGQADPPAMTRTRECVMKSVCWRVCCGECVMKSVLWRVCDGECVMKSV